MKVLVTGGRGYVGGRVCAALSSAGHDVVVGVRMRQTAEMPGGPSVACFDVTSEEETGRALSATSPDAVVHLAALNEIDALRDPQHAYRVNCDGTFNLLAAAARAGARRLIYVSTFHVYGGLEGRITEESPTASAHPYATTHRAAEDIARYFARYQGVSTASLRLSNGYGAPMRPEVDRWTLAINDFCRQAVVSGSIVLATAGGQHRDFISLHDVGRAILHALASPGVIGDGEVFNLGGRRSMSIREAADLVARIATRMLGVEIGVRAPEGPSGGRPVDYDISRLEATGFELAGSMEDEIVATLALCRAAVESGAWVASVAR